MPALRASDDVHSWKAAVEDGLAIGVGGFILFGGEAAFVRQQITSIRRKAAYPLLFAADLERGAGQQFGGATELPPAAALGSLSDLDVTFRAGELTAREAVSIGIDLVFAPVADVGLEALNPIVGTRAFSTDPAAAAAQVAAWVGGCRRGGALSCAKHFPGHGRTTADSHMELPEVNATEREIDRDLLPFRAAIAAGVDAVMTAHVAFPELDDSRLPATLSHPIVGGKLRDELGFSGVIVSDGLGMAALDTFGGGPEPALRALEAGCDILLYPRDPIGLNAALRGALATKRLPRKHLRESLRRIEAAQRRVRRGAPEWGQPLHSAWALETAVRTVFAFRGRPRLPSGEINLIEVDDDARESPESSVASSLAAALVNAGVPLSGAGSAIIGVRSNVRAGKGRAALSAPTLHQLRELCRTSPDTTVILFADPRAASDLDFAPHILAAWSGQPLMQRAAARWLLAQGT